MKSDNDLKRRVEEELRWEPRVRAAEIGVAVKDGVVTLSGDVGGWAEKWGAEHAVERVAGVAALAEEIEVRLPIDTHRTEADIARSAASALAWNVSVPAGGVKVRIEHGWITLSGVVASARQRHSAEEAVRRLPGVRGVTNLIALELRVVAPAGPAAERIEVDLVGNTGRLYGTVRES